FLDGTNQNNLRRCILCQGHIGKPGGYVQRRRSWVDGHVSECPFLSRCCPPRRVQRYCSLDARICLMFAANPSSAPCRTRRFATFPDAVPFASLPALPGGERKNLSRPLQARE